MSEENTESSGKPGNAFTKIYRVTTAGELRLLAGIIGSSSIIDMFGDHDFGVGNGEGPSLYLEVSWTPGGECSVSVRDDIVDLDYMVQRAAEF